MSNYLTHSPVIAHVLGSTGERRFGTLAMAFDPHLDAIPQDFLKEMRCD